MDSSLLEGIDAVEIAAQVAAQELSCVEVAQALVAAIGDDPLRAWARVDPEWLLEDARQLDSLSPAERADRPLLGVPVGIKDNFDTADLVTEYGSPIYSGFRPVEDAAVVARLRTAGALIAGKLACCEFAWMTPPDTRNPLAPERTPGGSSNGSAAAVAAGTVPLATGSQTAGSVNRPASYCGVFGFKPSFGVLPREGVKLMSWTLDTVGLFARSVGDLGLGLSGLGGAVSVPPVSVRLAFARTGCWEALEDEAAGALQEFVRELRGDGVAVDELELPGYVELARAQETIQRYESARSLSEELSAQPELLSPALHEALLAGAALTDAEHADALMVARRHAPAFGSALAPYDAVLTPSTTGVPPLGLDFTGDPLFCRVWTLIGAPALSLPLVWTKAGLPVGLQLVAAPGCDGSLLGAAAWLTGRFAGSTRPGTAR